MSTSLDLTYPAILANFSPHRAEGRSESRAFLAWFLEHYYHLDEQAAQDCVCDGIDDKGIDGIYVDDNLERVDVFQAKLYQNAAKTAGDRSLRDIVGTLTQLTDAGNVEDVATTTRNFELRNLLRQEDVSKKVHAGYEVKGVFLTNAKADRSAFDFASLEPRLTVYDAERLSDGYISVGTSEPVSGEAEFDTTGFDVITYRTPEATVIVAPLLASELVKLEGIQSGELFDWNVRQSLGRTKVNRAIAQSVQNQLEHTNFLLYHNGLTVLTTALRRDGDTITLSGYSVVNGCQSLTSLYDNREKITSDLRLLARLIQLPPNSTLAALITRHSNNQNSIGPRDLQSNSMLQRRLQNDVSAKFPGYFYEIKRGENVPGNGERAVVTNADAGRILLAFDLEQPWTCHQTYKLFDELHNAIFARPEVRADRIVGLYQAYVAVVEVLTDVRPEVLGKYRLVRFFLLYLLRSALEADELGRRFCRDPASFLAVPEWESGLRHCFRRVLTDLVIDLNEEVGERDSGNPFDYKRELKSPQAVRALRRSVIPIYKKTVARDRITSFGGEWRRHVENR